MRKSETLTNELIAKGELRITNNDRMYSSVCQVLREKGIFQDYSYTYEATGNTRANMNITRIIKRMEDQI